MLHGSSNRRCDQLLLPFQLASPPGFHVTHMSKGNLVRVICTRYLCSKRRQACNKHVSLMAEVIKLTLSATQKYDQYQRPITSKYRTLVSSNLSKKRGCSPKGVKIRVALLCQPLHSDQWSFSTSGTTTQHHHCIVYFRPRPRDCSSGGLNVRFS